MCIHLGLINEACIEKHDQEHCHWNDYIPIAAVIDVVQILHVCVLAIFTMELTNWCSSCCIPVPCEETDKLHFVSLMIVNSIILELSREMIDQSWHR